MRDKGGNIAKATIKGEQVEIECETERIYSTYSGVIKASEQSLPKHTCFSNTKCNPGQLKWKQKDTLHEILIINEHMSMRQENDSQEW